MEVIFNGSNTRGDIFNSSTMHSYDHTIISLYDGVYWGQRHGIKYMKFSTPKKRFYKQELKTTLAAVLGYDPHKICLLYTSDAADE